MQRTIFTAHAGKDKLRSFAPEFVFEILLRRDLGNNITKTNFGVSLGDDEICYFTLHKSYLTPDTKIVKRMYVQKIAMDSAKYHVVQRGE